MEFVRDVQLKAHCLFDRGHNLSAPISGHLPRSTGRAIFVAAVRGVRRDVQRSLNPRPAQAFPRSATLCFRRPAFLKPDYAPPGNRPEDRIREHRDIVSNRAAYDIEHLVRRHVSVSGAQVEQVRDRLEGADLLTD